jgi:hypothetical protein
MATLVVNFDEARAGDLAVGLPMGYQPVSDLKCQLPVTYPVTVGVDRAG